MTNPFYTKTGNPGPNTQGRSGPIRDEFALVEAGFDAVNEQTDENLLRAIRLPIGDDGDLPVAAAAREHLFLAFDANGDPQVWPPNSPASRANTVVAFDENGEPTLATAGSGYSWLPSMAGKANFTLSNDGIDPVWRGNPGANLQTPAGSYAATAALEIVDPASFTSGNGVTLPDARTLRTGFAHIVELAAGYGLYNNDGTLLATGNGFYLLTLLDNSTQNGVWRSFALTAGPATGNDYALLGPATTLVASQDAGGAVVEISTGVYLVATGTTGANGIKVTVITATGMQFTAGTPATVGTDTLAAASIRLHKLSTGYAVVYATASGGALKAIPVSISGTTVTAGTTQTVVAALLGTLWSSSASGDKVMVAFADGNTVVKAVCLSYAANAITVGAAVTLQTAVNTYNSAHALAVAMTDASSGFLLAATRESTGPVNANNAYAFTLSGTTITVGAAVSFSSLNVGTKTCALCADGANNALAIVTNTSTAMDCAYLSKAGTVVTVAGTGAGMTVPSYGSRASALIVKVAGLFAVCLQSSAAQYTLSPVYLSGSTPTATTGGTETSIYFQPVEATASTYYAHNGSALRKYSVAGGVVTVTDAAAPSGTPVPMWNTAQPHANGFLQTLNRVSWFSLYNAAQASTAKTNY